MRTDKGKLVLLFAVIAVCQLTECKRSRDKFGKHVRSPAAKQARLHHRKGTISDRTEDPAGHNEEIANVLASSDKVDCHKAAVHWCGKSFTKVSKLLNFLSGDQAFQAKCALRKAFFTCLDKIKEKPCKKYHKFHKDDNFRKKLADKLWATRVCVLGVKDAE
ncbi:uncharacterized protein [Centruroides vittatus]|uniref:uncharacterized protein n=1 Tax=Centruroides vittatus TaxID=120091 RepID=UPI00350EBA49